MESGDGVDVSTPQDLPLSTEEKVAEAEVVGGVEERKIAAVVGTLVADAAAAPLHWIYDDDKLDSLLEWAGNDVGFWEPSRCPFYTLDFGSLSGYGDQAYVILDTLVENKGLDLEALKKATLDCFGSDSEYEKNARNAIHKKTGEPEQELPIEGPWRHSSIKHFMQNVEAGKPVTGSDTDNSVDCCVRIVPIVAMYAGQKDMLKHAETVIRQTQNMDICVAGGLAAARLLEYYILNGPSEDAVQFVIKELSNEKRENPQALDKDVITWLQDVLQKKDDDHIETARKYKLHCALPDALQSAIHAVITSDNYYSGIQANILVGGDNCGRCGFIGACLGAQYGLASIPEQWKQKTTKYWDGMNLAIQLATLNKL